jgi:hypothetical protein
MSHDICTARAVAVTDKPGMLAVADCGPHVRGVTSVHIHIGNPTSPVPAGGAVRIDGPSNRNRATACAASCSGVIDTPPKPAGGSGRHSRPPPVPATPGHIAA